MIHYCEVSAISDVSELGSSTLNKVMALSEQHSPVHNKGKCPFRTLRCLVPLLSASTLTPQEVFEYDPLFEIATRFCLTYPGNPTLGTTENNPFDPSIMLLHTAADLRILHIATTSLKTFNDHLRNSLRRPSASRRIPGICNYFQK